MTENKAINEIIKEVCSGCYGSDEEPHRCSTCGFKMAKDALKEIQAYRAIGTVEELQKAKEQYDDINSVAEKTALYGLCDYGTAKEAVITEIKRSLDYSLKEYQKIGTVEEFKALKERSEPKAVVKYENGYKCPVCNHWVGYRYGYCDGCGQKLDWSEEGGKNDN